MFLIFLLGIFMRELLLPLLWGSFLSYRNQFFDLQSKSMDWFPHDRYRHERVNPFCFSKNTKKFAVGIFGHQETVLTQIKLRAETIEVWQTFWKRHQVIKKMCELNHRYLHNYDYLHDFISPWLNWLIYEFHLKSTTWYLIPCRDSWNSLSKRSA